MTQLKNLALHSGCEEPVDCVGSWSECDTSCERFYTVSRPATGTTFSMGEECEANNDAVQICNPGEGLCPLEGQDCIGLVAPANGGLHTCPLGGILTHGASCEFECYHGFILVGDQPACAHGSLIVPTCEWRGNPGCWSSDFPFSRCCDTAVSINGDSDCWSDLYTFDTW